MTIEREPIHQGSLSGEPEKMAKTRFRPIDSREGLLLLYQEDLPEEARAVLNLPERPLVLPLSASAMSRLTGCSHGTILRWANQEFIGRRLFPEEKGPWQFMETDLLIAAAILIRGKSSGTKQKQEIARRIRSGHSLSEVLNKKTAHREKLISLQKALQEAELSAKSRLNLREAAQFLAEIGPGDYPGYATLAKLIKIAVILDYFPLSPEAIRIDPNDRWKYRLSKRDLAIVLGSTLLVLETRRLPFDETFKEARRTFQEERERRNSIEALMPLILQPLGFSTKTLEFRKKRLEEFLVEKLQEGKLPLPFADLRPQEVLILGVLPENQEDCVSLWAKFTEEKGGEIGRPSDNMILKTWPALTTFLREQIEGVRITLRYVPEAVAWLRREGVPVTTIKMGETYRYHRLSPRQQEQLEKLLRSPEKRRRFARILNRGEKRTEPSF